MQATLKIEKGYKCDDEILKRILMIHSNYVNIVKLCNIDPKLT